MMQNAAAAAMLTKSRNGMIYIAPDVWDTSLVITLAGPGYPRLDMYPPLAISAADGLVLHLVGGL